MIFTVLYLLVCTIGVHIWFSFGEFITVAIIDIIFAVSSNMVRNMVEERELKDEKS